MTDQPAYFRRRAAEVEAVQWTDNNAEALTTFAGRRFMTVDPEDRIDDAEATASLIESAHECWSLLRPGDWVIKRGGDDFAVLTPVEFADLYEAQPGDEEAEEREDLLDTYRQMINDAEIAPRGSIADGVYRFLLGEVDRLRAQAALRERIAATKQQPGFRELAAEWAKPVPLVEIAAQAIRDSNGTPEALEWWRTHQQLIPAHVYAAAVLAVLPAPADRAAVLEEAADAIAAFPSTEAPLVGVHAWGDASARLRRMAAEVRASAQQDGAQS